LIEAWPRERGPQQDKPADQHKRLQKKPDQRRQPRPQPTAEEQRHGQRGNQRYAQVLADEEHPELHARIFRVIPGHQLALRFRQVEGQPVRLGDTGDEENPQPEKLRDTKPHAPLRLDDLAQVERAGEHHYTHQRQTHEDFVAQHLRRRPQAAQQRVLVVRSPPGQYYAVSPHRRHRQKKEQSDVEVNHHNARRERDDGVAEQRGNYDYRRGDDEDRLVGEGRNPIFLGEDLDHVGQHLQQSERADTVRPITILPQGQQPSLQPDQAGADGHCGEQHADDDQEGFNDFIHTLRLEQPTAAGRRRHAEEEQY